jgi:predicted GH43/DUF377 family glycosyl hydrolase
MKRLGEWSRTYKETDKGWLEIYHGATKENRCLGALLLKPEDQLLLL